MIEQAPRSSPEMPTYISKLLVEPVQREALDGEGDLSGELGRGSKGLAIDWGSPEVLERYGSLEPLFVWSSPEEGGSSDEEWYVESSTSITAISRAPESIAPFPAPPTPLIKTSTGALLSHIPSFQQRAIKAPDSCVLPGRGKLRELPRLSRFQRDIQKRVAQEYGFDYPYVPEEIMNIVEASREQWERNLIWDYLHVPKPQRTPDHTIWVRFQDIFKEWRQGRAIYKNRVLVKKPGQHTRSFSISVKGEGDSRKRLLDPRYYL